MVEGGANRQRLGCYVWAELFHDQRVWSQRQEEAAIAEATGGGVVGREIMPARCKMKSHFIEDTGGCSLATALCFTCCLPQSIMQAALNLRSSILLRIYIGLWSAGSISEPVYIGKKLRDDLA